MNKVNRIILKNSQIMHFSSYRADSLSNSIVMIVCREPHSFAILFSTILRSSMLTSVSGMTISCFP